MRRCIRVLAFSAWFAPALASAQSVIEGKVVRVIDGDSIAILNESIADVEIRIRLEGIDAPDEGQPFNKKAEQALIDLVWGKNVVVTWRGRDKNLRRLGFVSIKDEKGDSINQQLVARGLAWHLSQYSDDPKLAEAEKNARAKRVGLWSDANPIAPWKWRDQRRLADQAERPISPASPFQSERDPTNFEPEPPPPGPPEPPDPMRRSGDREMDKNLGAGSAQRASQRKARGSSNSARKPAADSSAASGWPRFSLSLNGDNEVRITNPNDFVVTAGLRSGGRGKDFTIRANSSATVRVPDGRYDVYFRHSNDESSIYQGDSFTLNGNNVEIQIVQRPDGNYKIRKVR